MALEDQIINAESNGDPTARNPRSSATGAGQFIDSTWLDQISRNRPDLMQGRSQDEVLALRNDPSLSRDMTAAYARDNAKALSDAGLPVTPGSIYLSHFAGPQGAINLLRADPSSSASAVLGDKVSGANPFLRNMSVGDLASWAGRKAGGQPGQGAPATSAAQPMASQPPGAVPFGLSPTAPDAAPGPAQPAPQQAAQQAQPQQPQQQQAPQGMQPLPMDSSPLALQRTALAKQRMLQSILRPQG